MDIGYVPTPLTPTVTESKTPIVIEMDEVTQNPHPVALDDAMRQVGEQTGDLDWLGVKLSGAWLLYTGNGPDRIMRVNRRGAFAKAVAVATGRPVELRRRGR